MTRSTEINNIPTSEAESPLYKAEITENAVVGLPLDAPAIDVVTDTKNEERPVQAYVSIESKDEDAKDERFAISIVDKEVTWLVMGDEQRVIAQKREPADTSTLHSLDLWDIKNNYSNDRSTYSLQTGHEVPTYEHPEGMLLLSKQVVPGEAAPSISLQSAVEPERFDNKEDADWNQYDAKLPKRVERNNRADRAETEATKQASIKGRKIFAAFAAYAAIKSGGLIDRVGETFQNADQTVHSALADPNAYHSGGAEINTPKEKAEYDNSVDRVAQAMEDWDEKNMAAIHDRAEAFKKQYSKELMPEQRVAEFKQRVTEG